MKPLAGLAIMSALLVVTTTRSALADESASPITVRPTTIHGRVHRPAVTVVVSRERMTLGPTTPTLSQDRK